MYFQAIDTVISDINDPFKQSALKKFRNIEELYLKAINKADSSKELKVLESDFRESFDRYQLENELHLIPAIFKQSIPVEFREICKIFQDKHEEKRPMIKNIWTIIRIVCDVSHT